MGRSWVGGVDLLWRLRSWSHHPTIRCALVPPSSLEEGSFWFRDWSYYSTDSRLLTPDSCLPTPDSRLLTPDSCLPTPARRGGPRLSVVGWFGAVGRSFGDLLHGPGPKLPTPAGRRPPLPSALPTPLPLQASLPPTCRRTRPGSPPMALSLHGLVVTMEEERAASRDALAGDDGGRPPPGRRPSIP